MPERAPGGRVPRPQLVAPHGLRHRGVPHRGLAGVTLELAAAPAMHQALAFTRRPGHGAQRQGAVLARHRRLLLQPFTAIFPGRNH